MPNRRVPLDLPPFYVKRLQELRKATEADSVTATVKGCIDAAWECHCGPHAAPDGLTDILIELRASLVRLQRSSVGERAKSEECRRADIDPPQKLDTCDECGQSHGLDHFEGYVSLGMKDKGES